MPVDFPASPSVGQTYTAGARTWMFNGLGWESVRTTYGPTGPTGPTGPYSSATLVCLSSNAYLLVGDLSA